MTTKNPKHSPGINGTKNKDNSLLPTSRQVFCCLAGFLEFILNLMITLVV